MSGGHQRRHISCSQCAPPHPQQAPTHSPQYMFHTVTAYQQTHLELLRGQLVHDIAQALLDHVEGDLLAVGVAARGLLHSGCAEGQAEGWPRSTRGQDVWLKIGKQGLQRIVHHPNACSCVIQPFNPAIPSNPALPHLSPGGGRCRCCASSPRSCRRGSTCRTW